MAVAELIDTGAETAAGAAEADEDEDEAEDAGVAAVPCALSVVVGCPGMVVEVDEEEADEADESVLPGAGCGAIVVYTGAATLKKKRRTTS